MQILMHSRSRYCWDIICCCQRTSLPILISQPFFTGKSQVEKSSPSQAKAQVINLQSSKEKLNWILTWWWRRVVVPHLTAPSQVLSISRPHNTKWKKCTKCCNSSPEGVIAEVALILCVIFLVPVAGVTNVNGNLSSNRMASRSCTQF